MSMFGDLFTPETIRGLIVVFLLILFVSGKGFKIIGNLIRQRASNW